ncbi:hypothetical protein [Chitinivorax sp. B]|uniref:hypothetical protein n=1 Tax=Chitinivorax sp. B TaxID=2502235 RepID=UPI0010F766EE|nr:hypothetical protein [Chitinivorax sp. B]
MANQYNFDEMKGLLKEVIEQKQAASTDSRTPWYQPDDQSLDEYTHHVIHHLNKIQDSSLNIATAVALEAEEADGLTPKARIDRTGDLLHSALSQQRSSDPEKRAAQEKWIQGLQRELTALSTIQQGHKDSVDQTESELNLPNIRLSYLGNSEERVRVYTAIVGPTERGSPYKDLKLDENQGLVTSGQQIWMGIGTPYRALGWLQKYQLENVRGSDKPEAAHAMIRTFEVSRTFIDQALPNATVEGGVRFEGNEPRLAHSDVKVPNQFALDTTTKDGKEASQLNELLKKEAIPGSFATISLKANLRSRVNEGDGKHIDVNRFMQELGIPISENGPNVYLLDPNSTMFHTRNNDGTWGFSTPQDQLTKINNLSSLFGELEQYCVDRQFNFTLDGDDLSDRISLTGRRSSIGSEHSESSEQSLHTTHSESSEQSFHTAPLWSPSEDYLPIDHAPEIFYDCISDFTPADQNPTPGTPEPAPAAPTPEPDDLKSRLGTLLHINRLTPGALLAPRNDLTVDTKDIYGNNKVKSAVEREIARQVMGDKTLDMKTVTSGLLSYMTQELGKNAPELVAQKTAKANDLEANQASIAKKEASGMDISEGQANRSRSLQNDIEKLELGIDKALRTSPLIERMLSNHLVKNDLAALTRSTGELHTPETLMKELKNFADRKDDKSMRLGGNLFFHCLRVAAHEINNNPANTAPPTPLTHDTIDPTRPDTVPVNNRQETLDPIGVLNQSAQAYGLPFDRNRSNLYFSPNASNASQYMKDLDVPFTGGISGTTRDICTALPTIAPNLNPKEQKDLFLSNAAFMVENQYHSMFEALYPAARYNMGGNGQELINTFDRCRNNALNDQKSNTELYQRTLYQMTGSTKLWNAVSQELDNKLRQAPDRDQSIKVSGSERALPEFKSGTDDASRYKVKEVQYDKQVAILEKNAQQRDPEKNMCYVRLSQLEALPEIKHQVTVKKPTNNNQQIKSRGF